MKTLLITGSPRKQGRTNEMTKLFLEHLGGEVEVVDAYRANNISPCVDCRFCWLHKGCIISDGMEDIYEMVEEADNIILASPVYFHSVPGPLKTILDRFQIYWAGHVVRKDLPKEFLRKGAILLCGGAPEFQGQFDGAKKVLESVLADLNAECLGAVCLPDTDQTSLEMRPDLMEEIKNLADKMKES